MSLNSGVYSVNVPNTDYIPKRWGTLVVDKSGAPYNVVSYYPTDSGDVYTRTFSSSSSTPSWYTGWIRQPSRTEVDALNSKMSFSMLLDRDLNAVVDSVPFAIFLQNNSRNATSERHYPIANSAGFMLYSNIETWHLQVFFFFNTSHIYFRAWYDNEGIVPDWRVV